MFKVERDGRESHWKEQQTGIRQGCPLSPYLFLIVMTVMFHDIHEGDAQRLKQHRVEGTSFDEILYADDTICLSTDTKAMNKLLASIETESAKYGMQLNKTKCELVTNAANPNIHFANGNRVPQLEEVKYLGCHLNNKTSVQKEIKQRLSVCMTTLRRLDLFWRHSDCPKRFKLLAHDAVIRSKLLYGLETAQTNTAELAKLNAFQLKGLRKILRLTTTYIDRSNSNETVYAQANEALRLEERHKPIKQFSEVYETRKLQLIQHILALPNNNPLRETSFQGSAAYPLNYGSRRQGRPKNRWANEGLKQYWQQTRHALPTAMQRHELDLNIPLHNDLVMNAARLRLYVPHQ